MNFGLCIMVARVRARALENTSVFLHRQLRQISVHATWGAASPISNKTHYERLGLERDAAASDIKASCVKPQFLSLLQLFEYPNSTCFICKTLLGIYNSRRYTIPIEQQIQMSLSTYSEILQKRMKFWRMLQHGPGTTHLMRLRVFCFVLEWIESDQESGVFRHVVRRF